MLAPCPSLACTIWPKPGLSGWKAWAYPVSVELLLVAAWRRLRTARRSRSAWTWFVIALTGLVRRNHGGRGSSTSPTCQPGCAFS
ncbi:DUF2637 domain-containing protein [Streptomyces antibioticus]|uniref:DUF2637 domain-containing protein n=1 Tax=Streptomyces antibioticus TaxID=1890 RepID=UPI0037229D6E